MNQCHNKTVLCLMGPTAAGKTSIAVKLAQTGKFAIISVDSAQIYLQMNIGTAKPDTATLKLAPHRLIDFIDPSRSYSVGEFVKDATSAINAILKLGKIPLLVGGTMMYFNALQNGLSKLPESNKQIRQQLTAQVKLHGLKSLHQELSNIDLISANKIHPNDSQRIIRALEVYQITGISLSQLQSQNKASSDFNFINFKMMPDNRQDLRTKITQRFDQMLAQGLVAEVERLFKRGDLTANMSSIKSVGYRQVWAYLNNEIDYTTMRQLAITATCQFAKRQLTWLRRWDAIMIASADDIYQHEFFNNKNHS